MPSLQAILFDLDGTLLDSAPDIRQALNLTLKTYGNRDLTLADVKGIVGDGLLVTMHRAFALTGTPISDAESFARFQDFIAHYRNQKPDPSQIYPHVVATLQALQQAGVKLGICTNKQEAATLRLLDQLDLAPYFSAIAGGDTFAVHKPNPGHVQGVLERLGVVAPHAVMIGDSVNDVRAAQGAGIPCLVVTHGYGVNVHELGANGLIDGFDALPKALDALGFENIFTK